MNFSVQSALHHPLSDGLTQAAYEGLQWGKSIFSVAHRTVIDRFTKTFLPPAPWQLQSLTPEAVEQLQQRRQDLLKADWLDAQTGLYPTVLLFDTPWDGSCRIKTKCFS